MTDHVGNFYPDVSELLFFDRYVIHILKDMITERSSVNICSLTSNLRLAHKLRVMKLL